MSVRYPISTALAQEGTDRLHEIMQKSCVPVRAQGESRQEYFVRVASQFYTTPEKVEELLQNCIGD